MEPGTIVALVGIGVLFFLVLFIWFTAENAHKKVKNEFKFATGAAFAFQQQITDVFDSYAKYISQRKEEIKTQTIALIDEWMLTMGELIELAEVARLRTYMYEKLDVGNLDGTIVINQEIIADLNYASSGAKQAILTTLNKLDTYLYNAIPDEMTPAKTKLLTHQVGTTFAASLAYAVA